MKMSIVDTEEIVAIGNKIGTNYNRKCHNSELRIKLYQENKA